MAELTQEHSATGRKSKADPYRQSWSGSRALYWVTKATVTIMPTMIYTPSFLTYKQIHMFYIVIYTHISRSASLQTNLKNLSSHKEYGRRVLGFGLVVKGSFSLTLKFSDFFFFYLFIFWLHWVFAGVHRLSLVAASRGYSLVVVHRLLTAVASPVSEHEL